MTGWERNAKRAVKGVFWVLAVMMLGRALDVKITFPVIVLITMACFVDHILNLIWPTGSTS